MRPASPGAAPGSGDHPRRQCSRRGSHRAVPWSCRATMSNSSTRSADRPRSSSSTSRRVRDHRRIRRVIRSTTSVPASATSWHSWPRDSPTPPSARNTTSASRPSSPSSARSSPSWASPGPREQPSSARGLGLRRWRSPAEPRSLDRAGATSWVNDAVAAARRGPGASRPVG